MRNSVGSNPGAWIIMQWAPQAYYACSIIPITKSGSMDNFPGQLGSQQGEGGLSDNKFLFLLSGHSVLLLTSLFSFNSDLCSVFQILTTAPFPITVLTFAHCSVPILSYCPVTVPYWSLFIAHLDICYYIDRCTVPILSSFLLLNWPLFSSYLDVCSVNTKSSTQLPYWRLFSSHTELCSVSILSSDKFSNWPRFNSHVNYCSIPIFTYVQFPYWAQFSYHIDLCSVTIVT